MDCSLDQGAEVAQGLDFASQAGLLASHYCETRGRDRTAFTETSAANYAAWAKHAGGAAPSGAELRRDLVVSPPLVRSDFAHLLDGACAVLLTANNDDRLPSLDAVATASDVVALWERPEALAFRAVAEATATALDGRVMPHWLEIDCAVSVAQILAQEALSADATKCTLNVLGGSQGRGRVLGASALYQLDDIISLKAPYSHVLLVAVGGLASRAYAAHISRGSGA
jgi:hypothetical protein